MASVGGILSDWRHGTNGATGVLTDFSAKTMSVELDREAENEDATAFQSTYRSAVQSFKNGTIECEYLYDTTIHGQLAAIFNGGDTVIFALSPTGTANGEVEITGSMFMTNLGTPVEVGEVQVIPVSWQTTGAITDGVHS
jgi:hypothetical protein